MTIQNLLSHDLLRRLARPLKPVSGYAVNYLESQSDGLSPQQGSESAAANGIRLWKTALLAASSACLGGVAVVLWHRRELQRMRQAEAQPAPAENRAEIFDDFI